MEPSDAQGLSVGDYAPLFAATDLDGKTVRLDDFQGRWRILAFISPGCSPCAETIEILNAFLRDEHDVAVLMVGSPDSERNRAYSHEQNAQMPILTPDSSVVEKMYHVKVKPFVFVLNEAGIIRSQGGVNQREHLQELLAAAF